jgi:hypothetical protein
MEVRYEGEVGALIGDDTWQVMFQQVAEYNPPQWPDPAHPQQGHLDIDVEDLDAAETKVLRRGRAGCPGRVSGSACSPTRPATPSASASAEVGLARYQFESQVVP